MDFSKGSTKANLRQAVVRLLAVVMILGILFTQSPAPIAQAQTGIPQLILNKSTENNVTSAQVGDVIRYRIRFECSSLTTSCGIMEITDVIPAGMTYLPPPSSSVPGGFTISYNGGTRTVTITRDDLNLPDGSQFDATIAVQVDYNLRPLPQSITNTVTGRIDPPGAVSWQVATPASAPPISIGGVQPSWAVTKSLYSPSINPTLDTDVTYLLRLCPTTPPTGSGNAALESIIFRDTLPAGSVFISASNGGTETNGVVTWPAFVGPVYPPNCVNRYVTMRYPDAVFNEQNTITNTASVQASYLDSTNTICVNCFNSTPATITHIIDIIKAVPTYTKTDAGDPVGFTGTARFNLNLNTNGTNFPANDVTLIDNLPAQLQVTEVTSGQWSSAFDYVRAYIEYSTNNGNSYTAFPSQPISYNTNSTITAPAANITNVRWRFEYDSDETLPFDALTTRPGLPYTWAFTTAPQIRVTPRATPTTADAPSNANMPAAVIGSTYTNCLQVTRVDNTGAVTDPCFNETMTVQGDYASLRISKTETAGNSYDNLDDPTIATFTSDTSILPGDTLRYVITMELTERSSAPLIDPIIQDTLPNDLIFVRNGTAKLDNVTMGTQPTFTQSGPNPGAANTLRWDFTGLSITPLTLGSHTLTVEFYARIPVGQSTGTRTNNVYVVTNSTNVRCEVGTQVQDSDNGDIDGDGDLTDPACQRSDTYVVERSAALRGEKWIRSTDLQNAIVVDATTFLPDATCPNGGTTGLPGGGSNPFTRFPCIAQAYPENAFINNQFVPPPPAINPLLDDFEYNLRIFNDGNVDMLNYVLYDILPYYGDKGSGGTLASTSRLSEFRPYLRGPVTFLSGTGLTGANFTIQYNTTTNPCRPEVFNEAVGALLPAGCNNTWTSDWTTARSYRIRLNAGSVIQPAAANEVRFGVPMYIPSDTPLVGTFNNDDAQSREIAWNSFAHVGSYDSGTGIRDLLASEPRKVGITIPEIMSVGNRVWRDSDNSGTINAPDDTNPGILGVVVNLYRDADNNGSPDGPAIATTTTDVGGYYLFSNILHDSVTASNNRYIIGIPASNFLTNAALDKKRSSTGIPASTTYTNPPTNTVDSEDDGIDPITPGQEVFSASFVLTPNSEPLAETDLSSNDRDGPAGTRRGVNGETDNDSDLTIDFGFFGGTDLPFSIGNHVWFDNGTGGGGVTNDGIRQAGEPPVVGVDVRLYRDGNGNSTPEAAEMIRTDITDANGFYLFDNLDPGSYYVEIPASEFGPGQPLDGWFSSQTTGNENVGVPTNTNLPATDSDDNGIDSNSPETSGIFSGVIVLSRTENEQTSETHLSNEADPDNNAATPNLGVNPTEWDGPLSRGRYSETDEASNLTVDFGFIPPMSLGNRVWFDSGAGTTPFRAGFNNGLQDGTEPGVNGVRVELWRDTNGTNGLQIASDTFVRFVTTDTLGYYLFEYIQPGTDYYIHIPDDNFGNVAGDTVPGNPLANYISSYDGNQTTAPADDTEDKDDNGIDVTNPATAGITSSRISMAYNSEPITPTNETDVSTNVGLYGPDGRGRFGQADADSNLTMDFGFVRRARSIGNYLWFDNGTGVGGINNNGIRDGSEPFVPAGTRVSLYQENTLDGIPDDINIIGDRTDDWLAFDTTDANGYYLFDNLPPGSYLVGVDRSNFAAAGTLFGFISSTGNVDNAANNLDSRDNGVDRSLPGDVILSPHGILSTRINMTGSTLTGQPTGETVSGNVLTTLGYNPTAGDGAGSIGRYGETDAYSDLTIDFGFVYIYSLGNRVWFDTNNDNLMDLNEQPVNGVQLELYRASGSLPTGVAIATTTTANGGYYLFNYLTPGSYVVVVTADNFIANGTNDALVGYWSSAVSRTTAGLITETAAPDPDSNGLDGNPNTADDDIDRDDNGTRQGSGAFTGAVLSLPVTLGGTPTGDTEPTLEGDLDSTLTGSQQGQPDNFANMKVDFGFYRTGVGDLVFADLDKDGFYSLATDTILSTVAVNLYSADGITLLDSTTTNTSGIYNFTGQPDGEYVIKVTPPEGMVSTLDTANTSLPDNNTQNDDNGVGILSGEVSSTTVAPLSLTPGSAQTYNTVDNLTGTTTNPTMDFGFAYRYAIGNRLWFDTNNNSTIDTNEEGVMDGVAVELWTADLSGTPTGVSAVATDTTTTSGGVRGYYLFNGLESGDYVVVIPSTEFEVGGPLHGYWSSATTRTDAGDIAETEAPIPNTVASDVDDNGTRETTGTFTGAVVSGLITLETGANEPPGETDLEGGFTPPQGQPDAQSNLTVDFGFYTIQLGDLVWNDANNDGLTPTETGLSNVDLQLWAKDGLIPLQTVTSVGGTYSFSGLPQGNYFVRIPAAEFNPGGTLRNYISSTAGITAPFPYEPGVDVDGVTTDHDDNGTAIGVTAGPDGTYNSSLGLGGYVQSTTFALSPGAEATFDHALGLTSEPRVDFGLYTKSLADLVVTKTDGVNLYIPSSTLNYTITITNKGPSDVFNAQVDDAIPPQVATWSWTCAATNPVNSNCSSATLNSSNFQDFVDLLQGESLTYQVTANIAATPSGRLDNTVTVTNPVNELNLTDNTATDQDDLASLQVTKDDGLSIVSAGNTITYQVVVTNNGMVDLTDITVTDTLPDDLTFVSAIPAPASQAGNILTWTGIALAKDANTSISITATVKDSPASTITNTVTAEDSLTKTKRTVEDTDSTASVPNNNITKTLVSSEAVHTTNPEVAIGEILTYEVVMSVPTGSMNNALLVDLPQTGLAFVDLTSLTVSDPDTDGSSPADTGLYSSIMTFDLGTGVCTNCADGLSVGTSNPLIESTGNKITYDFGTLTNSGSSTETITIRYTMIVLDIASNQYGLGTTLTNSVTWSWGGNNVLEPKSPPVVKVIEPELSIDKSAQPNMALYGAPVVFTLDIAHTAQSTADAFDVIVKDVLPSGLSFIPGTEKFTRTSGSLLQAPSFDYDTATTTLTFVWDEFQLGQSAQLEFQAIFVGPSPVDNSANVEWTSLLIDPTPPSVTPDRRSIYNTKSTERWYDPASSSGLDDYGVEDTIRIHLPQRLPRTGFEPGVVFPLTAMPANISYTQTDLMLEIPRLGVKLNILGVPFDVDNWNLTWLSGNAGWLEGSAFPTHAGNSALTAHAYLADGTVGPFAKLSSLRYGDQIIIHLGGQRYIYEIRQNLRVGPNSMSVLKHEEYSWLTLITCDTYNEKTKDYTYRVAVRAVLVKVE